MNVIESRQIEGTLLQIDNTHFKACHIRDCEIVWSGAEVKWESTVWERCRFTFTGEAAIVLQVMRGFGFKVTPPNEGQEIKVSIN
jgi:hypothetical protein